VKYLIAIVVAALGFYYAWPLITGPSRVIDEVTAFSENDTVVVQVNFAVPVRYENHFPERSGEFLQVKLRLVSLGKTQWKESLGLSKVRPELAKQVGLVDVAFEGDVEGGPLVTFLFTRAAEFELRQDTGLNTLMVVFPVRAPVPGVSS
jgi:hypothetical protein